MCSVNVLLSRQLVFWRRRRINSDGKMRLRMGSTSNCVLLIVGPGSVLCFLDQLSLSLVTVAKSRTLLITNASCESRKCLVQQYNQPFACTPLGNAIVEVDEGKAYRCLIDMMSIPVVVV